MMQIKDRVASAKSDNLRVMTNRLLTIEGHATEKYFGQVFSCCRQQ